MKIKTDLLYLLFICIWFFIFSLFGFINSSKKYRHNDQFKDSKLKINTLIIINKNLLFFICFRFMIDNSYN